MQDNISKVSRTRIISCRIIPTYHSKGSRKATCLSAVVTISKAVVFILEKRYELRIKSTVANKKAFMLEITNSEPRNCDSRDSFCTAFVLQTFSAIFLPISLFPHMSSSFYILFSLHKGKHSTRNPWLRHYHKPSSLRCLLPCHSRPGSILCNIL